METVALTIRLPANLVRALDQLPQNDLRGSMSRSRRIREAIAAHVEAEQRRVSR